MIQTKPWEVQWLISGSLAENIVLRSWARHLTLTVPGVTLRWTSIPTRGSRNTPGRFMLRKPG